MQMTDENSLAEGMTDIQVTLFRIISQVEIQGESSINTSQLSTEQLAGL
jgi:hypothetical protein